MVDGARAATLTGAPTRLDCAVASRPAESKFAIVVNPQGSAAATQKVAHRMAGTRSRAHAGQAGVLSAGVMRQLFDEAGSVFEGVDILANNAGAIRPRSLADDADVERQLAKTPWP